MKLSSYCDKIIEYSFYAIFLLVPLFFTNNTSELFELNKMWLTWYLTIIIAASWTVKMIANRQFSIRRSPLDIPLLLFLASQIISTIFSLDTHISLWGYYSRFNGGLYSLIAYVFLYFAFVSNMSIKQVMRTLYVSLAAGILVAFWGIPSHFGHDPTCLLFRGTFDVSCWTSAFQPTVRIFSTLGQPAWLAAYIGLLVPVALALGLRKIPAKAYIQAALSPKNTPEKGFLGVFTLRFTLYLIISGIFYLSLLYSDTRAGFLAFWIGFTLFWSLPGFSNLSVIKQIVQTLLFGLSALLITYFASKDLYLLFWLIPILGYFAVRILFNRTYLKPLIISTCFLFLVTVLSGSQTSGISSLFQHSPQPSASQTAAANASAGESSLESGGTDSGKIRLFVWKGALDAWKTAPLFGTGVETFAFAYYLHKPVGHNLTSEWDYLYNKAHNEYLNYLTTTGIVGLGTYLLVIFVYLFMTAKYLLLFVPQKDRSLTENSTSFLLPAGIVAAYIIILASNFFGFSVVIINVYFFLIPGLSFLITRQIIPGKTWAFPTSLSTEKRTVNPYQWTAIVVICGVGIYLILTLARYWSADTKYALGHNLDLAGQYQDAYPYLTQAVSMRKDEPVFTDELAVNEATLATALAMQKDATNAALLAQQAINLDDQVVSQHPNDVVMWKDRLRIFYTLAEANPQYLEDALKAALQAFTLAPTDAKIAYNLGVIYEQTGDPAKAVQILSNVTGYIKPDYRDAYYALALAYHDEAVDKSGTVIHPDLQQKAVNQLHYILSRLSPTDKPSQELLKSWGAQ